MTSANNGILGAVSGAGKASPIAVRTALVSVYDKTGLDSLGKCLASYGVKVNFQADQRIRSVMVVYQILSTGGTAKKMKDLGCSVMDVSEYTGSPEILDGRVKTLHPKVRHCPVCVCVQ